MFIQTDQLNCQNMMKNEISKILKVFGFELIDDKKSKTIDKIKTVIIDLVQNKNNDLKINLYLNSQLKLLYKFSLEVILYLKAPSYLKFLQAY